MRIITLDNPRSYNYVPLDIESNYIRTPRSALSEADSRGHQIAKAVVALAPEYLPPVRSSLPINIQGKITATTPSTSVLLYEYIVPQASLFVIKRLRFVVSEASTLAGEDHTFSLFADGQPWGQFGLILTDIVDATPTRGERLIEGVTLFFVERQRVQIFANIGSAGNLPTVYVDGTSWTYSASTDRQYQLGLS